MKEKLLYLPEIPVSRPGEAPPGDRHFNRGVRKRWQGAIVKAAEIAWPYGVLVSTIDFALDVVVPRPKYHLTETRMRIKAAYLFHPARICYATILRDFLATAAGVFWVSNYQVQRIQIAGWYPDQNDTFSEIGTYIRIVSRRGNGLYEGMAKEIEKAKAEVIRVSPPENKLRDNPFAGRSSYHRRIDSVYR